MEKGKRYLVSLQGKKKRIIREIECVRNTKTCYLIRFRGSISNSFSLDLFDEKIEWILKPEFEEKFEILEELLPDEPINKIVDAISNFNVNTTMDELFGVKKEDENK